MLIYQHSIQISILFIKNCPVCRFTGSSKIQDLHFRSQWFMISRRGIKGFTPFEKVTMAHNGNWGDIIDERFCVP